MGMMFRRHYEEVKEVEDDIKTPEELLDNVEEVEDVEVVEEVEDVVEEEVKDDFICPECGREFATERGLKGHITKVHRHKDGDENA